MITIHNLAEHSESAVFNFIAKHLLSQKKQSKRDGMCEYRGEEGMKCAAGCLIPDDEYDRTFENNTWKALVKKGRVSTAHQHLIVDLQFIHDSFQPVAWRHLLTQYSTYHDLSSDFGMMSHHELTDLKASNAIFNL